MMKEGGCSNVLKNLILEKKMRAVIANIILSKLYETLASVVIDSIGSYINVLWIWFISIISY
ncbi:hypothetical protein CCP2SC5_990009 [Azospirillaceae bacterium]